KRNGFSILEEAKKTEDIKESYHKIQKALSRFIADKLNLPIAGISAQRLLEEVKDKKLNSSALADLKRIFEKCETVAYAPNISKEDMETDIQKSRELIKELGKVL
ncbi:MAG: protein BatD, partial [Balneola sp.]